MTSNSLNDASLSDDEVYFGRLSLKEVKHHIFLDPHRKSIGCTNICPKTKNDDNLTLIKTTSQPNLILMDDKDDNILSSKREFGSVTDLSVNESKIYESWDHKTSDESFLNMEKMIADMCTVQKNSEDLSDVDGNNTLEEIDFILQKAKLLSDQVTRDVPLNLGTDQEKHCKSHVSFFDPTQRGASSKFIDCHVNAEDSQLQSPLIIPTAVDTKVPTHHDYFTRDTESGTPSKINADNNSNTATPKCDMVFKTPAKPSTLKKGKCVTSAKKTPMKSNLYEHIRSPVASYIKNSPQVPFVKDIHPKKPLSGMSAIPKLIKHPPQMKHNKENINLPSLAYRSAKETKVINLPDVAQLPKSQWAMKVVSSQPHSMVTKHNLREKVLKSKPTSSRQEESFADLTLYQADVSVLTQKSAELTPNTKK